MPGPLQGGSDESFLTSLLLGHWNRARWLSVPLTSSDYSFCTVAQNTLCLGHSGIFLYNS